MVFGMWSVEQTLNFLFAVTPLFFALFYVVKGQSRNIMLKLSVMTMLAFSAIVVKSIIATATIVQAYFALTILLAITVLAK